MTFMFVLIGVLLNAAAQIALKHAVHGVGSLGPGGLVVALPRLLLNPMLLVGLVLYAVSVANWLIVLSRMDLAIAYPLMSLAYVLTFIYGVWVFGEGLSGARLLGIVVILLGIVLITRPLPVVVL